MICYHDQRCDNCHAYMLESTGQDCTALQLPASQWMSRTNRHNTHERQSWPQYWGLTLTWWHSLDSNFWDCSTSPPGLVEDMDRLVFECNQLSNLANSLYRESRFTGSPILISPLGRIVSLNETISEADREKYMEQWPLYGATAEENNVSRKNLKEYNHLILTTNGLVDEPMRASMSKPMKELMNDRGKV